MELNIKRIPAALIVVRGLLAPTLIAAELLGAPGIVLAAIVAIAFASDILDGVVGRALDVATDTLRSADSIVDTIFYVAAVITLALRGPNVIAANAISIAVIVSLEVIRQIVERFKYGRMAAYHMWSAKAWGIALLLGFSEAFITGMPGPLFRLAVFLGIITDIEGLAASIVLSKWYHDVPSIWHAVRIELRTQR